MVLRVLAGVPEQDKSSLGNSQRQANSELGSGLGSGFGFQTSPNSKQFVVLMASCEACFSSICANNGMLRDNFNGLSSRMTHEFMEHTMLEGKMLSCRGVFRLRSKRES